MWIPGLYFVWNTGPMWLISDEPFRGVQKVRRVVWWNELDGQVVGLVLERV